MLRPPAGLGYISEILDRNRIEWDVMDMGCGYRYPDIKKKIERYNPDLIAVSAMTFGYTFLYEIVANIKRLTGDKIPLAVGGAHVSTFQQDVLNECRAVDFGFVCEGEDAFLELVQGKALDNIAGLIWRKNGQIVHNGPRPFRKDLDSVPFPRFRKFELRRYVTDEIPLVTSRGCPYRCIFCASEVAGKSYRVRSASNVVDEIEYWVSHGKKHFDIVDDNFTLLKDRVHQICDELDRRKLKNLSFRIGSGARADRLDRDLLKRMKQVGFNHIAIGIESGSEQVLRNLNKKANLETMKDSIKAACDAGMDVTLFFLIGSPGETWQDFERSLELAKQYPVFEARFHNLVPFPGTALYDWVSKENYFLTEPKTYLNEISQWVDEPVFETPSFSKHERQKALAIAGKVRKQIIKAAIERKLNSVPLLNKVLAGFLSSDFGQRQIYFNRRFRRLVDWARRFVVASNIQP